MNIKIADRLIELRKERVLSQEQLAEKLGVSRQAISKWERAEASPDTDNLICLAKLYGISLDELLLNEVNKEVSQEEIKEEVVGEPKEEPKDKKEVKISPGGIHVNDGDKKVDIGFKGIHVVENGKEIAVNKATIKRCTKNNVFSFTFYNVFTIFTALVILVVITYLLLGFLTPRGWEVGWVLFLLIPVIESIFSCVKTKQVSKFDFTLLVTNIFCYIGMMWNIWHPTWIVFILIPVFYIIAETIDKKRGVYHSDRKDEISSEFVVNIDEDSEVEIKEKTE